MTIFIIVATPFSFLVSMLCNLRLGIRRFDRPCYLRADNGQGLNDTFHLCSVGRSFRCPGFGFSDSLSCRTRMPREACDSAAEPRCRLASPCLGQFGTIGGVL